MRKSWLPLLVALLTAVQAQAKLKLPALVGDHMVLQKGSANVWGWADPGEGVTVSVAGKTAGAKAGDDGRWKVSLLLPKAGGPYPLTVSTSSEAVTLQDVLVGEVWIGSGQSNMEFSMKTSSDADKEIPAADFPQIRLFTVERTASLKPLDDVQGSWKVCSPTTVPDFSAVAYHFGKEIHQTLKVPVGLIEAAWGGSGAEAWTPRDKLDKDPALTQLLKDWDNNQSQIKTWTTGDDFELQVSDIHILPKDPKDKPLTISAQPGHGLGGAWSTSAKPGSQAAVTLEGKAASGQGPALRFFGFMKGGGWGGLTTTLSEQGKPLDLSRYQAVEFYAKGKGQFRMTLGQPSITDYDYYATANVFDAPQTWQKMSYDISSLKQGGWGALKPFTPDSIVSLNFPVQVPYWPDIASALFNGMTVPLTNCSIRGVLWYQGESNTGRAGQYAGLLTDLITGWREDWGKSFPFLIIQLPNFMAAKPVPTDSQWAELREAQLKVSQTVPDTGLITTIDLGDANNIHPKDKTDVGHRVALAALKKVYHKKVVSSGPLLSGAKVLGGKMLLRFTETGTGLATQDGGPVTGFALAGDDGAFQWATAKITGPKTLEVSCDGVKNPTEVRYAWADNPACNLTNKEGLPASPFRFSPPQAKAAANSANSIPAPPGN